MGIWIALPVADWLYRRLTGNKDLALTKDDLKKQVTESGDGEAAAKAAKLLSSAVKIPLWTILLILLGAGVVVSLVDHFTNEATAGTSLNIGGMVLGWAVMIALTVLGIYCSKWTKGKLPGIAVVMTLGAYFTSPAFPWADTVVAYASNVNTMAVITMLLAIAGLSLGKDLPMLKGIGWKIIPVGIVAITASFLIAAVIAEFALGLWHV